MKRGHATQGSNRSRNTLAKCTCGFWYRRATRARYEEGAVKNPIGSPQMSSLWTNASPSATAPIT